MFGMIPFNKRNAVECRRPANVFDFDSMFDNFFSDAFFPTMAAGYGQMKVDIRETEKEYLLEAELPGVRKEDIGIEYNDDRLTISVVHNDDVNEERENYIRRERRYGKTARSFYVEGINRENICARYENGILTVALPKDDKKEEKNRRIDIQ